MRERSKYLQSEDCWVSGGGRGRNACRTSQLSHVPGPQWDISQLYWLPSFLRQFLIFSTLIPSEYEWHEQWYSVLFDIYKHSWSHQTEMSVWPPLTLYICTKVFNSVYSEYLQVYHVSGQSRVQQQSQLSAGEEGGGRIEFVRPDLASPGHHYNDLIIAAGAPGQSQLQRPSGRREWAASVGQCEPGLRGGGHRLSCRASGSSPASPPPTSSPAPASQTRATGVHQLQSEVRPGHLLLQTLPTVPHPAQIQLLRSVSPPLLSSVQWWLQGSFHENSSNNAAQEF